MRLLLLTALSFATPSLAFTPAHCSARRRPTPTGVRHDPVQASDDSEECLLGAEEALGKVEEAVTSNIIKGAAKGGSYGTFIVNAAAKIKRAAQAARGSRAVASDDPAVNDLAACLRAAADAQEVDRCMAQYCDNDEECAVDYSHNSCEAEAAAEPSAARPRRGGIIGRLLRR